MSRFPHHIFRAYDIRGIAYEELSLSLVKDIGAALASAKSRAGLEGPIVVGRDCRPHGADLCGALVTGLLDSGADVIDLGVVPTPLVYFARIHHQGGAAVVVTGSHNPPEYNGFKMMLGAETLYGDSIADLRRAIIDKAFVPGSGRYRKHDISAAYVNAVMAAEDSGYPRASIVIDGGNGTAGPIANPLYRRLGHQVDALYCDMDGDFPNHHPDPSNPANLEDLSRRVVALGAACGLAYDGDADRLGVVDARGEPVAADRVLALLSADVLQAHPGRTILAEVKCSEVLFEEIERLGGNGVMGKVGHSLIKKRMKEEQAILAGELSGHFFFADRWHGFDDAIYAGVRVLQLLRNGPLHEQLSALPTRAATPELHVACAEDRKAEMMEGLAKRVRAMGGPVITVDGLRVKVDGGWFLVRPSNTQPVLVLRVEADTAERMTEITTEVQGLIEAQRKALR